MPNSELPDPYGAQWQNEIERRLRALETAPRLTNSSVQNGSITFYDASTPPKVVMRIGLQPDGNVGTWIYNTATGNPVLKMGTNTDGTFDLRALDASLNTLVRLGMIRTAGPDYGMETLTPGQRTVSYVAGNRGQVQPRVHFPASGLNFFYATTVAAASTELFRTDIRTIGDQLHYDFQAVPAGSTMSYELTLVDAGGGAETVFANGVGITINTGVVGTLDLTTTAGATWVGGVTPTKAEMPGRLLTFRAKAWRTAGASAVGLTYNSPVYNFAS